MTDPAASARLGFLGALAADPVLWSDFQTLCDFGGRLTGTPSEVAARNWAAGRMEAIGGTFRRDPVAYDGWECRSARLVDCASGRELAVAPLLHAAATPAEGLELEVLDLGRGAPEQIRAAGETVRGKAVLVRHEYPFAAWTVHRRFKLAAAMEAGAAAFLASGSVPRRVRLFVHAVEDLTAMTETLVLDLPGAGPNRVVLSAHIDGHALAESALDNGTGVAAALALARAAAPHVATLPRGLTLCLFSAEEWALTGSRRWLEAMAPEAAMRWCSISTSIPSLDRRG